MQTVNQKGTVVEVPDLVAANKKNVIRVLHVDDDPSIREISKLILMDMGSFEIDDACCVDEAFKKLVTESYDVVVSDYEMPIKNGLQFLQELREQKNDIPFILFTGKGREEVVIKALNLGANRYVNKQGTPETVYAELASGITQAVEHAKTQSLLRRSEERFSFLSAATFEGIGFSEEGKIVDANNQLEKMLGYSHSELLGRKVIDLIAPESRDFIQVNITSGTEGPYECLLVKKDGSVLLVEIRAKNMCYKGQLGRVCAIRDISERKKNEGSLKESEEKFRNLAEESPNMIFIYLQGRVVYANKKCEEITRYSREEFYSPNFNFLSLVAPESVELLKSSYAMHMRGEEVPPYEYGLINRDGQRIEVIITSKLIEYNGRKALLGLVTDITERKRNEATLQQSEEQFRQLFSSMPSGVAIYEAVENGEDFIFRDFNSAAEKIEKISKTNILGKRLTKVFPNVKSFGVFEVFQRVWRTGQPEYYPVALYKDDKDLDSWRENWVYKLPNGHVIAIYNDISERMKTDAALRQERNMLESVTTTSGAGLVIISKDYHVLWANDFIKRYRGDTIGKLCYANLNSLDAPCPDCGVAKIYAGKTTLDSHEYCSTTVYGNPYWVEIVATPSPMRTETSRLQWRLQ